MAAIAEVHARQILDSRGNPTIETEVRLDDGAKGVASVPSGASTGKSEALELRDREEKAFGGLGVLRAIRNAEEKIAPAIRGLDAARQGLIDRVMIDLDGTRNKRKLGANAILSVSLATAKAAAASLGVPLYRALGGMRANLLPVPMMNILNGGRHSDAPIEFQEFMICPFGAATFSDALRMGAEIFHALKSELTRRGLSTAVGDEGGFAPQLPSIEAAIELILKAVELAGCRSGLSRKDADVFLALDCAASEFYLPKKRLYRYAKSKRKRELDSAGQIEYLAGLCAAYPIGSVEDGMAEQDWEGWILLTEALGGRVRLVGDDLLTTNPVLLERAIARKAADAILIKPNQIGTLSETLDAIELGQSAGWRCIVSHRSGETEDALIADLAVGMRTGWIKAGAPSRGERLAKYNRLLRIEEELGSSAAYGA